MTEVGVIYQVSDLAQGIIDMLGNMNIPTQMCFFVVDLSAFNGNIELSKETNFSLVIVPVCVTFSCRRFDRFVCSEWNRWLLALSGRCDGFMFIANGRGGIGSRIRRV